MEFNQTVKVLQAAMLCTSILVAFAPTAKEIDDTPAMEMQAETVFSRVLRFRGDVVDITPSGQQIRKTAFMRGKRFEWVGKMDKLVAAPETGAANEKAPDIDSISVEELAENLRGIAMFQGHQFVEAEPAMALAIRAKQLRELERHGASNKEMERLIPSRGASQGKAKRTVNLRRAELGELSISSGAVLDSVHGSDDRRVMNNHSYPHRTHIVFDNVGSTGSIGSSQGSGTLIGPSTAMSVAHVFWNEAGNTWEGTHRWAPGYDSAESDRSPWGEWYGCYWVTIPTAYTIYENSTYDYAVLDFDVGCNSVRNGVNSDHPGTTVGWLGSLVASDSTIESRTGYLRGYPGSGTCGNPGTSCGVRVWGDHSWSSENNATGNDIRHQADSSGGQSGSGFYLYTDPSCSGCGYGAYVVGMHRAGSGSYNLARRYTSAVSSFMHAYSSDY